MSAATDDLTAEQRVDALATLLNDAIRVLGKSALTRDEGCRLGARAWALARPVAPEAANRLNATLHRLSRANGPTPAPPLTP